MRILRSTLAAAGAATIIGLGATGAAAADGYNATLDELNDSGAESTAMVTVDGTTVRVEISGTGFTPEAPHAQHLHGAADQNFTCPTPADVEELDEDGDGLLNTMEAAVMYGGVMVSLTTEGDTSGDSALAVDRFPVADSEGNLEYSRTFEVSQEIADGLSNLHLVQHGIDIDGSGTYDGDAVSSLDESLPLEATIPATCGAFGASQSVAPIGGVETGDAGANTTGAVVLGSAAAVTAAAGIGFAVANRRRVQQ
ncbi:hypothetical protein [Demequina activiva]|uniref:CHRD domain-containing protein n=1 Tax=Demequina activiva TaxID=1582364 RepID=A0A919Q4D7_9MICO|nr:hypothetical protein [Demequina activiva]GIG54696.1 hypothetical protein Dac01nite_14480 [Demequina activiva]